MTRIAWYAALVLATLAGLLVLWQFSLVIVLFFFSLAVAAAFRPAVRNLTDRGLPHGISLTIVYGLVVVFMAALFYLSGRPLLIDLQNALDDALLAYERMKTEWPEGESAFQQTVANGLPPIEQLYEALTGEAGAAIAQALFGAARGLFDFLSSGVVVLILSIYWSADQAHFERILLSLLPADRRIRAREIWRIIERDVGAYLRSEFVQSLLAGVVLWAGYRALGVDYPVLLASFGAFVRLIPWLGGLLAFLPAFLIPMDSSISLALLSGSYTVIVLFALELLVAPRGFDRRRFSSFFLVVIMLVLTEAYGLPGLILAPPLAATLQLTLSNIAFRPAARIREHTEEEFQELRDRYDDLRQEAEAQAEQLTPETMNLLHRLEGILESAAQIEAGSRLSGDRKTSPMGDLRRGTTAF